MGRPSSDPLSLPGPSGWWVFLWQQHKYSAKRHGFWQPKQAMMQRSKNAWNLLFFPQEKEESEDHGISTSAARTAATTTAAVRASAAISKQIRMLSMQKML
ncbi:hypothetical protein BOTNAR_0160g00020 [Botryotinia narcissicola]|uniref:Uncharacterized protein n=1 Tax=Botryotinia narcissicola TaxID=278944 RepID=A0A4Z1IDP6_9HELO|nr:hypothetical protein BOTNAR_0160g00020 [Botryotinia narcissicola]